MTSIVYFFGLRNGEYSSFPQDYTQVVFKDFLKKSKSTAQMFIHRKENMLHYGYIRNISKDNFFGICLCLDRIYNNVDNMFKTFDELYSLLIEKGEILQLDERGNIKWTFTQLNEETVTIHESIQYINKKLDFRNELNTSVLPPPDFSISVKDCIDLSLEDSVDKIIDATKRYTNLYIAKKNAEIEKLTSFINQIREKNEEIEKLNKEKENLSSELKSANEKQRNMRWIGILVFILLIFGVVIWNKVLFPSEVTHKDTGDFIYYGPMKNNKPDGIGIAIYKDNDPDERKYYIGKFVNGEREDENAILFYKDGDYYYGAMKGDKWKQGIWYSTSDSSHFKGDFKDNVPYTGTWYEHQRLYNIKEGKQIYK